MKISAFIATSLDGYIARRDGSLDWLPSASDEALAEDYGYGAFCRSVDCVVMGRRSMEAVLGFSPWPYAGQRVVVLSTTLIELPESLHDHAERHGGPLVALVDRLADDGCRHLYVDGGKTIRSFLDAGLLTDITITTVPTLLGDGIPLFGTSDYEQAFRHVATRSYANGLVQSHYSVVTETGLAADR